MKNTLLVPMVGKGRRFLDSGITIPKQLIRVGSKTMIEWSLSCIDYFSSNVIFIIREDTVKDFSMDTLLRKYFGYDITIIISEKDTEGTVSTCLLAENYIDEDTSLTITTLDTYFQPIFNPSNMNPFVDGCILTFNSLNPDYSYSLLDDNNMVQRTAEKEVISNHASVGLYHFTKGRDFIYYAKKMIEQNLRTKNEFYVCPLYNLMIRDGKKIIIEDVADMNLMGTPEELNNFLSNKLHLYER